MAILTVGPNSSFPTIADAMLAASANDTILLETGYSNETVTVTHSGMTISGDATSTGIVVQLATGIATFTLAGTAPITVRDAVDGNSIVGNDGDNVITVTGGADAVDGGLGIDRLVVDYRLTAGAVTGNSTTNFSDAGGLGLVTVGGGFEHFTILTGSGADTITTDAGDDIINTGEGASTVTAGQGANSITGGSGADTVTALDGGNSIDGGDGTNTLTSGGGNDVITGGLGADTIVAGGGNDLITVRGGVDSSASGTGDDRLVVDYSASNTAVTGGVSGGDLLSGYSGQIADLAANSVDFDSTENLTITTGSANDSIATGGGIDVLSGGAGSDLLNSAGGSDSLAGGLGNDTLIGGAGDDTINYAVGDGADTTDGGANDDTLAIIGAAGDDSINVVLTDGVVSGLAGGTVANIEHITLALAGGTDTLDYTGTTTPVVVNLTTSSATGFDSISGVENVTGGSGSDVLTGNGNANMLIGGGGDDAIDGGAGADTAVFTGASTDYTINVLSPTRIEVIDNRSLSPDGTDTITNIESAQFSDQTVAVNSGPVVENLGPAATSTEQTFALLDNDVTIHDAELDALNVNAGDYAGAFATITRSGGTNTEDDFSLNPSGASFTLSGNNLQSGGLTFATVTNAGGTQTIAFTSSGTAATTSLVNDVLRHVGYANQSDNPPASVTLDLAFNDGQGALLGGALSATQSLTVNISEVNDAPAATNDALSAVAEDSGQRTILGAALTGNDTSGPANETGQTLTVTAVSNVVGGSALVSGGNVLFTSAAGFNGAASFDYTVTDNGTTNGASAPQTAIAAASFNVTEVNDAPTATNDALSAVAEDSGQRTILGAALTGNDTSGPANETGQTLTVTAVSNVVGGSALVSGGNVLFTPAAGFNGAASFDYTVTDNGTTNGASAPQTAIAAASFTVTEVNTTVLDYNSAAYGDFDNNGRSDILFQNPNNGAVSIWQTNANGVASNIVSGGTLPAGYEIDGTGNFNSSLGDDILLRSVSGELAVWVTNGTSIVDFERLGSTSPQFLNSGIGDFTGDGQSDLLFRNVDTGQIASWQIVDNTLASVPQVLGSAPSNYRVVAVADFTGDHQADILFRDDSGQIAIWKIANNQLVAVPQVIGSTSSSFHVVGTGDFDGNGANDILFCNDSGQLAEWLLDSSGQLVVAPVAIGPPIANDLYVSGTGDLNGDGRTDIVFRDQDGALSEWLMNGASIQAAQAVGAQSNDFTVAVHHFDLI